MQSDFERNPNTEVTPVIKKKRTKRANKEYFYHEKMTGREEVKVFNEEPWPNNLDIMLPRRR